MAGGLTTAINAQVMQHGTGNNSGFVQRATVTARTATSGATATASDSSFIPLASDATRYVI